VQRVPQPAHSGTQLIILLDNNIRLPSTPFNIAVYPAAVTPLAVGFETPAEIARVILVQETGVGTHILTIQRKSEGNVSRAIRVGDQVLCGVTSADLFAVKVASASAGKLSITNNYYVATPPSGGGETPPSGEILLPFLRGTIVRPVLADYSWVNQEDSTVEDSPYGLYHDSPGTSSNLRLLSKPIPSGIASISFCILPNLRSMGYATVGCYLMDSVTQKIIGVAFEPFRGQLYVQFWNNPLSFYSTYYSQDIQNALFALLWFRIRFGATEHFWEWSNDGYNWQILSSSLNNIWGTPDHYCFGIKAAPSTLKYGAAFFSIQEA
jgi:hypothetical protein